MFCLNFSLATTNRDKLLNDIYLLTEGQKGNFLITATLSQNFGLELIESVLVDYADTITAHPEQVQIYRSRLLPLIMRILSEKASFPTTVRAMRIVQLTLSHFLFALASECEMMLSLINHMLDPDAAALWKRALCLEVFRGIHSDSTLVRSIYSHFDEQEHNRNIIRDHLATLVRLASEKPAIIGLGKQSSAGSHSKDNSVEQAAIQTDGLMSTIGAVVTIAEPDTPGINTKWSNPRVSCIEQLDKSEAPTLPATYIYGLALTCINSFSEGLAKFLLPFTLPVETKGKRKNHTYPEMSEESDFVVKDRREISRSQSIRSRKLPINPLKLEGHVLYSQICTSGQMVEHCWPALLATYSTFLNATLDSDYYHSLVRSFQRFAQVAGLLDLRTPRDAFLTTLSKHAVPLSSITSLAALGTQPSPVIGANDSSFQVENQTNSNRDVSPSPSTSSIRGWPSMDYGSVTMNTRNLLCLRALLNLGIALGPVLQRSWLIILETLQQADLVMTHVEAARHQTSGHSKQPSGGQTPSDDPSGTSEFGLEVAAVKTAATRMFESTSDLPYQAFIDVLECLCGLLRYVQTPLIEISEDSNGGLLSPEASSRKHHRLPSLSGMSLDGALAVRGNISVIDRLGEISTCNITRLLGKNSVEKGWEILVAALTDSLSPKGASTEVRTKAANVLNNIILSVIISPENGSSEESKEIRKKGLFALLGEINSLCIEHKPDSKICRTCDLEIHRLSIETLQSILEQCGDSLTIGWDTIFAIITSIFDGWILADDSSLSKESRCRPKSPQLLRSSFSPLQLICSDFLSSVPHSCLLILLETLYTFCSQEQDLNVALTVSAPYFEKVLVVDECCQTLTFFQTVSEFLQRDGESIKFNSVITRCQSETELIHVIQTRTRPDSSTALWLCLLLRLTHMANDSRAEVRHSEHLASLLLDYK